MVYMLIFVFLTNIVVGFRLAEQGHSRRLDSSLDQPVHASWDNHLSAFGAQNVEQILADYTDSSVVTVYNVVGGSKVVYKGLDGVRTCFEGWFKSIDPSHVVAPLVDVHEANGAEPGSVFLIWNAKDSGYLEATDTFVFDDDAKILWQNVVVNFVDPNLDPTESVEIPPVSESPSGHGPAHSSWKNHQASRFTSQNIDQLLKDYTEESQIIFYDQADGSKNVFDGKSGAKHCFEALFRTMTSSEDLFAPVVHVEEGSPGEIFLIWSNGLSGYNYGTDTIIFDDTGKILRQHIVVQYKMPDGERDYEYKESDIKIGRDMQSAFCSRAVPNAVLRNEFETDENQDSGRICKCNVGAYIGGLLEKCKGLNLRKFNPADMAGCECIPDEEACDKHVKDSIRRQAPGEGSSDICKCPFGSYVSGTRGNCPRRDQYVRKFNPLYFKGCQCL